MKNLVEYLLEVSFIAILIRCLVLGAGVGDAIIGISLVLSIVYKNYYINKNKIDDKEQILKELEDVKSAVTSMRLSAGITRKSNEKKRTYQDVDSNIPQDRVVNIHEMAESAAEKHLAQSYINLEKKSIELANTLDQALKALDQKEEEIQHLKSLLSGMVPTIGEVSVMEFTDEEMIADLQIRKLKDAAKIRELTLDEIRKFDLLVKNKRLAQGNATTINGENLNKKPKSELIKIASKKMIGE